ncbi:MAG: DUF3343 domain-containing protein [Clostridia bacterium]|nr:DUF3343 domain-containing protein [Clostridia bacterium]
MPMRIAVGSVSNAMRGKRLLEQHGIRAYVRRYASAEDHGCGYSLYLPHTHGEAIRWLNEGGVHGVPYEERDGG